jgi:hypothetical protein
MLLTTFLPFAFSLFSSSALCTFLFFLAFSNNRNSYNLTRRVYKAQEHIRRVIADTRLNTETKVLNIIDFNRLFMYSDLNHVLEELLR